MLSIQELRAVARRLAVEEFEREVGPFALVQRPPKAVLALAAEQIGVGETIPFRRGAKEQGARAIDLVLSFDTLVIATLPPVRDRDRLIVGRLPDCELVIENPSVSKRHAVLEWDGGARRALLKDEGSRNGTRVDGRQVQGDVEVADGEVISFGDVDFWFLLAPTLHKKLVASKPPRAG